MDGALTDRWDDGPDPQDRWSSLDRAAEEATPGPWFIERGSIAWMIRERSQRGPQIANVIVDADARYIALASPDRIRELIAENRRLREGGGVTRCSYTWAERYRGFVTRFRCPRPSSHADRCDTHERI